MVIETKYKGDEDDKNILIRGIDIPEINAKTANVLPRCSHHHSLSLVRYI